MASIIIHMCVAHELNKKLHKDENKLLLGAIAPDISKLVGDTKLKSHFLDYIDNSIPNVDRFLKKYGMQLNNDFLLGYYIHLYTDKIWNDGFIDKLTATNSIKLLDGTIVTVKEDEIKDLIYNDYTNLNIQLLDQYNMDLSLFYNELDRPDVEMDEIPIDKLQILLDKAGLIVENTKVNKAYTFDIYSINNFISDSVDEIYNKILKLNI